MENKSYDLQYRNMQANRSRMPMSYSNAGITNLPGPRQLTKASDVQSNAAGSEK